MKILDRVPELENLVPLHEHTVTMAKVCAFVSQAYLATQTIILPDNRVLIDTVQIVEPCKVHATPSTRPGQMNSIFFEKAWHRVDAMRVWGAQG